MNHATDAFKHAKVRAEERFELRLGARKHKQIIFQIQSGKAMFLHMDPIPGRSRWIVKIGNRYAKVIYCPKLNLIITIMELNKADWVVFNSRSCRGA